MYTDIVTVWAQIKLIVVACVVVEECTVHDLLCQIKGDFIYNFKKKDAIKMTNCLNKPLEELTNQRITNKCGKSKKINSGIKTLSHSCQHSVLNASFEVNGSDESRPFSL